jgi:inhibitor of cysteine peptidase
LAACSTPSAGPVSLTQKNAGATVHVKQGSIVTIQLEGTPSTGYTWEVAPGTAGALEQQGEPTFKAASSAVGSGGTVTLQFKAAQAGATNLKLIYHRRFEPNVAPLIEFDVTIVAE